MAKKTKKGDEAPHTATVKLPDTLPELKEGPAYVRLDKPLTDPDAKPLVAEEAPTEVTVVLSKEFRLNGKLYPAGRPVKVPADASHHMPVKTRL